jgi:large subunit ribosomal protein L22
MKDNKKLSTAKLASVKSSPLKLLKITKNLSNLSVSESLKILKFSNLKLAPVLYSLIYSAMSNAENNHGMDVDLLYIKKFDVGRSFALKRFSARGRGKSSRITKTFSNVAVTLEERVLDKNN